MSDNLIWLFCAVAGVVMAFIGSQMTKREGDTGDHVFLVGLVIVLVAALVKVAIGF